MVRFSILHGYPPTVREIAGGIGGASTSSIHGHIKALEAQGFAKRPGSHRQATVRFTSDLTADRIEMAWCQSTHGKRHRLMAEWLAEIVLPKAAALP